MLASISGIEIGGSDGVVEAILDISLIGFISPGVQLLSRIIPNPDPPAMATFSPQPSATFPPPTDTPVPTSTQLSGIWLDLRTFEITVQHPQSTSQPDWKSYNEVVIPVDGYVGGAVFTVEEMNGPWGGA